jgi:predicted nucleic acid-binding protein
MSILTTTSSLVPTPECDPQHQEGIYHERGDAIAQALDHGTQPTADVLSDVLEAVINYVQSRAGHDVATETLDAIIESSGFALEQTATADVDTGRSLFRRYEPLSLTDAGIVAAMQRAELEYLYSFADGFDSVSRVTRRTTPENPCDT